MRGARRAASARRAEANGEVGAASSAASGGVVRGTRVASVRGASGGGPVVQRAGAVPAARKAQAAAARRAAGGAGEARSAGIGGVRSVIELSSQP